jgi:dolichol-phosphate mannosyltransferase
VNSRVIVVLPAYNEEANIGTLLRRILRACGTAPFSVIVVNDGSSDGTARVLEELRTEMPLQVETHPRNMGLGATLRDGLRLAAESAGSRDIIVTMDADDSHDPEVMLRMVTMVQKGYDVVVASRYQPGSSVVGLGPGRRAVSWAASRLIGALFPTPGIRDFTCGYRAYSVSALRQAYSRFGDAFVDQEGFQCMVDVLLKLRRLPLKFAEVPMTLRYDLKLGKSKMRIWKTATRTLRLLWVRRAEGV